MSLPTTKDFKGLDAEARSSGIRRQRLIEPLGRLSGVLTLSAVEERVYNEEAFAYFLDMERKRTERSGRPFLLLVIDLGALQRVEPAFDSPTAKLVFAALTRSVRETDFTGWYVDGRVAAGVLTQPTSAAGRNVLDAVRSRILASLTEALPMTIRPQLRVRVSQYNAAGLSELL